MSFTQTIARNVLSDRLFESLRAQSQNWAMRCPCGAETTLWEMGGIRWHALGQLRRMGRCGTCQRTFWAEVYRRDARQAPGVSLGMVTGQGTRGVCHDDAFEPTIISHGEAGTRSTDPQADAWGSPTHALGSPGETMTASGTPIELSNTAAILLWIDGVGCWMIFPGDRVTIGGPVEPGSSRAAADLCALANLRRMHARIERAGESYRLMSVDAGEPTYLRDGGEIDLAGRLTMNFGIPSVLSPTAVLRPDDQPWPRMFTGDRTPASIDGIVLMDQVCLLGPGGDAHVACRDWEQTVILFRRNGQLWCRSQGVIGVDGYQPAGGCALSNGSLVSGNGWRFRVESVDRQEPPS